MPRKKWSKEKIIKETKKLSEKEEDISYKNMRKNYLSLCEAGKRYFGSWKNAIKATGLDYETIKKIRMNYWSKKKITEGILELYKKGVDLSSKNMNKNYTALYVAACKKKYFCSWKNAITVAGLDYKKILKVKFWDKEEILNRILELHKSGEELSAMYAQRNYRSLLWAAERYFGNWGSAITATGLKYEEIRKRKPKGYWTKHKIVEEIQALYENKEEIDSTAMMKKHHALFTVAKKRFGTWKNALTVAGLNYKEIRKTRIWNKKKIINKILQLHRKGEMLNARYVNRNHNSLYMAACKKKYFGGWKNAVTAAGLNYEQIRLYVEGEVWSKQKIIDKILELHHSQRDLCSSYISKRYTTLIGAAQRYFGSWKNAIDATGLDYSKINKYVDREAWSKKKIINKVLELSGAGEDLSYKNISKRYPTLCSAACKERFFGGWENAIRAAGLNYDEIRLHQVWDKDKIIDRILQLYDMGEELTVTNMVKNHALLYKSATEKRYFGNWENAINAARLDYEQIRMDIKTESYKGRLFEKYLKEVFNTIGKEVYAQKNFKFMEARCMPDFVEKNTDLWIDAKLRSYSRGIEETIYKYLKYVDKLAVYYLVGGPRRWYNNKVVFKCVKEFYPKLKKLGRDDIIRDLSLLERGIIPDKYQKGLEEFLEKNA